MLSFVLLFIGMWPNINGLVLIEFIELLPKNYLIAQEASSNIENLVVVDFEQTNDELSRQLCTQLHDINRVTALDKPCTLNESLRRGAINASVATFQRLKNDKIVLVWYDELLLKGNDRRRTRIVVMHLESCITINRDINQLTGNNPILIPSIDHGGFDVFIDDRVLCQNSARCVISYDLKLDEYSSPKPFDIDFEWTSLKIGRLSNGNLVICGLNDNVYKVLLINGTTGQKQLLMSILAVNPSLEFLSSGLSFCWTMPSVDLSIRCAQFRQTGELIFSSTVKFEIDNKLTLIHVHHIDDGQISLIFGEVTCKFMENCWDFIVATVDQRQSVRFEKATFHCTGDRKGLAIFDVLPTDTTTNIRYACRYENGYAYDRNFTTTLYYNNYMLLPACQRYDDDKQLFCT